MGVEHQLEQVGDDEQNAMADVGAGMSVISRGKAGQKLGVSFSGSGAPVLDMDYCPNNIRMSMAIPENTTTDDDIQRLVELRSQSAISPHSPLLLLIPIDLPNTLCHFQRPKFTLKLIVEIGIKMR